jgi:hypothetical protein
MATHSKFSIGILPSASFCERVHSVANHVLKKDNTRLNDKLLRALVILRINAKLFESLQNTYASISPDALIALAAAASEQEAEKVYASIVQRRGKKAQPAPALGAM